MQPASQLISEHAAFRALRTFPSLDGLRCLSIVPVIFHHSVGPLQLGQLGRRGFLGVDMFFVISGFLIVTLLLRERERHGQVALSRFYARRALRIMPLYYGVVLGLAIVFGVLARHGSQAHAFFDELPYYLTYTTNWFPITTLLAITWSLSAEEQFYLLWPPIEKHVRKPLPILLGLIVLAQLVHFHVLDSVLAQLGVQRYQPMLYETTFTPILLGVLLAHLLHEPQSFAWLSRIVAGRYASLVICALLLAGLLLFPEDLSGLPRLSLHVLMTLFLASCVVRSDHALAKVLQLAPVVRIGVLSYGMYLLHMFAVHAASLVLGRVHLPMHLLFPLSLLLTLVLAEFSYRFYESRFLLLKEKFAR